jgi:O-antigen/teichoic acid export membrane protein
VVCAVLMLGVGVGICNFLIALALIASGRPDVILRASVPEAIINIVANLVLIPRYGLMGAAAASVISRSVANPIFLLQLSPTHVWPTAASYLRSFLNLGIACATLWAFAPLGHWSKVLSLAVFSVLSLRFAGLEWADITFKNAGTVSRSTEQAT